MIMLARGAGDPDRIAHVVRILRPSPLDEVADAVAAYAASNGKQVEPVYVERVEGELYRWSPTSRGGSYPLLRLLAGFLRCEHTDLTVGFFTVDGWSVVGDPKEPHRDRYVILETPASDPGGTSDLIAAALDQPGS